MFVKVSMDGAPYLRKVDLKMYKSYDELSNALSNMFGSFTMGMYTLYYTYFLLDIRFHASYKFYQALSNNNIVAKKIEGKNGGEEGMIDFMNERKVRDLVNSWDYVPSYEDKDGDWMLVGDVPWPYVFFFFSTNFRSFLLIILITPFPKFTYLLECSLIHASVYVS